MTSKFLRSMYNKTMILLNLVFAIPRIIKVSVRVISLSLRLWLMTLSSTLIIRDITKTLIQQLFIMEYQTIFHRGEDKYLEKDLTSNARVLNSLHKINLAMQSYFNSLTILKSFI